MLRWKKGENKYENGKEK